MRTAFFTEMVRQHNQPGRFVPETRALEVTEEQASKFPDDQNPYKHPAVYRRMLREQAMARVRARLCQVPETEAE